MDAQYSAKEEFIGFAECPSVDANHIKQTVTSMITSLGLNLSNCRGKAYDGASNMSGKLSGVQARFKEDFPSMLFVHCVGHQLNLVVQDAFKSTKEGIRALGVLESVTNFIKSSTKRLESFSRFKLAEDHSTTSSLRPLCPTRWVMRRPAYLRTFDVKSVRNPYLKFQRVRK